MPSVRPYPSAKAVADSKMRSKTNTPMANKARQSAVSSANKKMPMSSKPASGISKQGSRGIGSMYKNALKKMGYGGPR